jgi:hypothetical protein
MADGTTHLRFEPLTLLERLASLTPRPRINVLIYHGLLAPHAAGRAAAVAYGRPAAVDQPHGHAVGAPPAAEAVPAPPADPLPAMRPARWRWADLLQRVFSVEGLACPNCGGRMRVLATIDDPRVVRRILSHLGLLGDAGPPPRPPPRWAA